MGKKMMTLEQFYQVEILVSQLTKVDEQISDANRSLGVTLRGTYHDDIANEVKPHVIRLLEGRRAAVVTELKAFGVDAAKSADE